MALFGNKVREVADDALTDPAKDQAPGELIPFGSVTRCPKCAESRYYHGTNVGLFYREYKMVPAGGSGKVEWIQTKCLCGYTWVEACADKV